MRCADNSLCVCAERTGRSRFLPRSPGSQPERTRSSRPGPGWPDVSRADGTPEGARKGPPVRMTSSIRHTSRRWRHGSYSSACCWLVCSASRARGSPLRFPPVRSSIVSCPRPRVPVSSCVRTPRATGSSGGCRPHQRRRPCSDPADPGRPQPAEATPRVPPSPSGGTHAGLPGGEPRSHTPRATDPKTAAAVTSTDPGTRSRNSRARSSRRSRCSCRRRRAASMPTLSHHPRHSRQPGPTSARRGRAPHRRPRGPARRPRPCSAPGACRRDARRDTGSRCNGATGERGPP